jgi:hypothetical protein
MTQRHITVLISFRSTKTKQLASFLYFLLLTVAPFPIAEQDATPTGCCAKPLASPQALSVSSPSQPSSSMAASLPYSLISPQGTAPKAEAWSLASAAPLGVGPAIRCRSTPPSVLLFGRLLHGDAAQRRCDSSSHHHERAYSVNKSWC